MTTLINILKKNHSNDLDHAMTSVKLIDVKTQNNFTVNNPKYMVANLNNNTEIATHGKDYNLIPYEKILFGLSTALNQHGIDLNKSTINLDLHPNLNYMRLRVLFDNLTHVMKYNPKDTLKFGIEVISSYDASIVFQLRTVFLRLICSNGMKAIRPLKSTEKKHTKGLILDDAFNQLKYFEANFKNISNEFEVLSKVKLDASQVTDLFKQFSKSDNVLYLLNELIETKNNKNKSTLYDVYNALTNYSTHNQRAIAVGKRNHGLYEISNSKTDAIKSTEARELEVKNFIENNKQFLYFYGHGVERYLKQ